jgi:hypothetical protein
MAGKRRHVMTPARQAALRKAQLASVRAKKRARLGRNRGRAPKRANRGEGFAGLRKNLVPYVRVNKRSQTGGFNVGTIIPGTNKRIVFGGYSRFENTNKKNFIDTALGNIGAKVAPRNSRTRSVFDYFKRNVTVTNPALRAKVGGAEVRLSTSRGAGPTIVLRRGRHKVSQQGSRKAIKRYDTNARKLNARRVSKPRQQRRNRR